MVSNPQNQEWMKDFGSYVSEEEPQEELDSKAKSESFTKLLEAAEETGEIQDCERSTRASSFYYYFDRQSSCSDRSYVVVKGCSDCSSGQ